MELKTCIKCGQAKSLDDFHRHSETRDKRVSKCKPCTKAYAAQWNRDKADERKDFRERNKEVIQERRRKYYAANRDVICAKNAARDREDRAAAKARLDRWKASNAEKMDAHRKAWKAANPDKLAADAAKRRSAKRQAIPRWVDLDKVAAIYAEAARLTRETGIEHHVDHAVPLISDLVCGLHWEENLQILPGPDNIAKSNRYWPDMP